jgi:hypothetical protein
MYIEEANHVKNLSKGITTTRKQEIAFKANKKSKNKQVVVESSSEEEEEEEEEEDEEEEEESSECDAEDMTLFTKKFKKYIKKKNFSKGDKKFKSTTNRTCYNCGKHGHFIANCPFECMDDDDDKKKSKPYKMDKGYKRSDKSYKKYYGEAHIDQEFESNDESSNSDNDGVATIAIKGTSSLSKSLFPKLNKGKNICLMAKDSKHKVKTKGLSSPKYVSSDDDDTPLTNGINEKGIIKKLGKELVSRDQLIEDQEDLLEQERKSTCEFKELLNLEKEKNKELAQELAQGKETISSLESSIGALQDSYDVLQKTHKDLEVQFNALWARTSKSSSPPETTKASTSIGCERCYKVDIDALCAQSQHSNVEQVLVESCDEAIGKESDNFKLEVKRLEQKVNMLEKQAKAQPSQDNYRNMVNKLEKGRTVPKLAPQHQKKPTHHKKEERANIDEKIEYARSVFLNVRRPHIKNGIGYKSGDKHNSRVNSMAKNSSSS